MSCYEWERGTITIPAGKWAGFRKALLKVWNDRQDLLLTDAKGAFRDAKGASKGKRGDNRTKAVEASLRASCGLAYDEAWATNDKFDQITGLVLKREGGWDGPVKLVNPKAKDLAKVALTKDCTVYLPDASVTFDNARKAVTWDVPDNNHAKDRAHDHWFAQRLFRALNQIKWTRNTGGTVVGNDEYNRSENDYEGGGGNYVTMEFSAAADKRSAKLAASRDRYSYGYYR